MVKMIICHAIVSAKTMGYINFVVLHSSYAFQRTIHKTHSEFIVLSFRRFFSPSIDRSLAPYTRSHSLALAYILCTFCWYSQTWYTFVRFNALPDVELSFICFCFSFIFCRSLFFFSFFMCRTAKQLRWTIESVSVCFWYYASWLIFWSHSYVRSSHQ